MFITIAARPISNSREIPSSPRPAEAFISDSLQSELSGAHNTQAAVKREYPLAVF
jgi:hypothetical protein